MLRRSSHESHDDAAFRAGVGCAGRKETRMKTAIRYCFYVIAFVGLSPVLLFLAFFITVLWSFGDKTWKQTANELLTPRI